MFIGLGLSLTAIGRALDAYAIAGFSPKLVFDPKAGAYRTGGNASTFAGMIDYTGASNKTMVDSDGVLKWAPHNLLTYSDDFDGLNWAAVNITVSDDVITATGDGHIQQPISTSHETTFKFSAQALTSNWVRVFNGVTSAWFDVSSGAVGTDGFGGSQIVIGSDGFYTCSVTASSASNFRLFLSDADNSAVETSGNSIRLKNAHAYRSDLGGMADNPDTGNSYVPTTSAARYLSRRGHHVYEGGEWVNAGMLVEPTAATNLVTWSNDFTNAAWLKTTGTSVAKDSTGPDGLTSGTTLSDDGGGGTGVVSVRQNVTVSTTTAHTFTVYAKASGLNWMVLNTTGFTTPGNSDAYFNLAAGTVGTVGAGLSALIENAGNGYYRCSITFTTDAADTSGTLYVIAANSDGSFVVDLDGTSSILIYGAQFEVGSVPSSYIPTAGSTATRAAETVSIAAAKLPYSATAMSIAMRGRMTYADTDSVNAGALWYWYNSASNYIFTRLNTAGGTGKLSWIQVSSGMQDFVETGGSSYSPGINVPFSIASRHGSTFINGAVDGTALTADLTPTSLPNLSATNLSLAVSGGPMIIEQFTMFDTDLGDSGISEASA